MPYKPPSIRHIHPAFLITALLLVLVLVDNVINEPPRQPTVHLILIAVDYYQEDISEIVTRPGTCKFVPTCSDYMRLAVLKHGSIKGVALGLWRILRCSPFTEKQGYEYP